MLDDHPQREALERFLHSDLPATEMRDILRHLLGGCLACLEITTGCWSREEPDPVATEAALDAEYDLVLDRVFARVESYEATLASDRARARELFEELSRHPAARQRLLVGNSGRFGSPALCELLIEKSHEAVFQDPTNAIELADLAVAISCRIAPAEGVGVRSLEARAWASLGNARRVASDLHGAEEALRRAEVLLADGSGTGLLNLLDRARVLDLVASLRISQRRLPEALRLLGRVQVIYQRLGQSHLLGRTLAQRAIVCGEAGDAETAIGLLRQALELLDPQEEPRMVLAARHNLILYLAEVGANREAFTQLFHTRPLYLQIGDRIILLRLRAVEGKVAAGLGRLEQAEVAYKEVRDAFVELGMDYDAAVVSLELAAIYARERRSEELRRLSEEMLPVFQSRSIHREALVALSMFRQAVEMEEAEAGFIQEIGRFLRLVRSNPDLRFQPSY